MCEHVAACLLPVRSSVCGKLLRKVAEGKDRAQTATGHKCNDDAIQKNMIQLASYNRNQIANQRQAIDNSPRN